MGHLLAWRDGVSCDEEEGAVVVRCPSGRVTLRGAGICVREAFRMLDPPGADEDLLTATIEGAGAGDLPRWYFYLDRLMRRSMIDRSAHDRGALLATLTATSSEFAAAARAPCASRRYILSRFAYLRRDGNHAVLESPLAHARITLRDPRAVAAVGRLAAPVTPRKLSEQGDFSLEGAASLLGLFLNADLICEADANREEASPDLRTWEFHDLLFHARTRRGRSDAPSGGTFRFVGEIEPPPALKPAPHGATIALARPDLEQLQREDPPLAWVQEQRRSIRQFDGSRPITLAHLSEFLFRVNRVNRRRSADIATSRGTVPMDFVSRPFPAGGSLYELEVYLAVNTCDGLQPGLYYHDPLSHRLIRMHARTPAVDGLLRDAAESTGTAAEGLQVLLVLAARVPRVAWKYESIAYSLVLKHVGVMFQTMYLAATAMGLAACAVGGGDADLFARAAGLDYAAETSVGEFLLGSRSIDPGTPAQ